MIPLKGIIFLSLNGLRLLSILSLILVFSAVVTLIAADSKAYLALQRAGELDSYAEDCTYYPDTEIPTSTWGLFWLQLHRFFILCIAFVGVMSELSFGVCNRFFAYLLPILGPSFSTAPLGVLQVITSASLLSRYEEGFALGVSWLLFIVGILNIIVGLVLGVRMKLRRSFFRSTRQKFDIEKQQQQGQFGAVKGAKSNKKSAIRQLANLSLDYARAGNKKKKNADSSRERQSLLHNHNAPAPVTTRPIRRPLDAFTSSRAMSTATEQQQQPTPLSRNVSVLTTSSEELRRRAREENKRIEREQEYIERQIVASLRGMDSSSSSSGGVVCGQQESMQDLIKRGQAGMSRDLSKIEFLGDDPAKIPQHSGRSSDNLRSLPTTVSSTFENGAAGQERQLQLHPKAEEEEEQSSAVTAQGDKEADHARGTRCLDRGEEEPSS